MAEDRMAGSMTGDEDRRARQLARLRFWRRASAGRSPDLVLHGGEGDGRPFVYFHGDYEAGGTYMGRFAGAFGAPLASISPHGLRGDAVPESVEAMAIDRMALVLSACPAGPYRLGGYCNGAILAYEVARQLVAAGHEVERVVMVEPPSLSTHVPYRAVHAAVAWLASLGRGARTARVARVMGLVGHLNRACNATAPHLVRIGARGRAARRGEGGVADDALQATAMGSIYERILPAYLPPRSAFPVTVLSSGKDAAGRSCALYDGTGWRRLCGPFDHVRLPGSHLSALMETTAAVAGLVRDALDARGAGSPEQRGSSGRPLAGPASAAGSVPPSVAEGMLAVMLSGSGI